MVTELRIGSNFFLWHRVCLRSNSDFITHVRHVHVGTCTCHFMKARAKTCSEELNLAFPPTFHHKVDPSPALVVRPPWRHKGVAY